MAEKIYVLSTIILMKSDNGTFMGKLSQKEGKNVDNYNERAIIGETTFFATWKKRFCARLLSLIYGIILSIIIFD